jgi:hypothetical protein
VDEAELEGIDEDEDEEEEESNGKKGTKHVSSSGADQ